MRLTGAKGFAIGVLTLTSMQLVLSSQRGTDTFGVLANVPTRWLDRWLDPTFPLISDHRSTAGTSGGSGTQKAPDCSQMWGLAKTLCQTGQASATQIGPPNTQIPTTSATAAQLSA